MYITCLQTPLDDGWGATSDGTYLIVGDSTDTLFFIDPDTMKIVRQIQVRDGTQSVKWLNELEWVDGKIYANVWQTNCIAQIDPISGKVLGWINMAGLRQRMIDTDDANKGHVPDVLNGIAYDDKDKRLFVTGKLWTKVYEIMTVSTNASGNELAAIVQKTRDACIIDPSRQF